MFCPKNKCAWYNHEVHESKTGEVIRRKCYYEPACWRGHVDTLFGVVKILLRRKSQLW